MRAIGRLKRELKLFIERYKQHMLVVSEINRGGGGTGTEVNLLLLAHALEKGMGMPFPRPKFGSDKADALLELLEEYHSKGLDEYRYAYREALGVLGAYFTYTDNDMELYEERFRSLANSLSLNHSGFDLINIDALYDGLNTEQDQYFIRSRHSIRSYDKRTVDAEILRKVIELASCAPSACNRQPVKVYATTEFTKVVAVSSLIPGNKGFEDEIPNWAIVTADRRMFGSSEPLQWYINGGIYLAYLVQSFHAFQIASCIFQIPATHSDTPKLRSLIGVPDNEAIIAAVGYGYAKKGNKVLVAARRPVDEVLVLF